MRMFVQVVKVCVHMGACMLWRGVCVNVVHVVYVHAGKHHM